MKIKDVVQPRRVICNSVLKAFGKILILENINLRGSKKKTGTLWGIGNH